jgi:hypothetical protein
MRVAPVQKVNVRWTQRLIDVCSPSYSAPSREASQSETRRIYPDLDRFSRLSERQTGQRQTCPREQSHHWKI